MRIRNGTVSCSLGGNSIGDAGAVAIATALKTLTELKELQ
jgi:hypothetical protein